MNFDGVNDSCSKGKDIIFTFVGFRVFGKVDMILKSYIPGGQVLIPQENRYSVNRVLQVNN